MIKRIDRVNKLIKHEFGKILQEHFSLKNGLVSVLYVKTTPDLRNAKVFITIFPFSKAYQILEELQKTLPKLQQILGEAIRLKHIPKIEILIDESLEYEDAIESLIKKIKNDKM